MRTESPIIPLIMCKHMKKIIYMLIFSSALHANAQRFNAGISAGLVATDVYGADLVPDADEWNDADFSKAGFMFGGVVGTALSNKFSLYAELNYIQKGTQQSADMYGNGYYKFAFNYLEFPLVVKYRVKFNIGQRAVNRFYLHAGAAVGQLISNKAEGDNFYSDNDDSYLNKTDVSLLAGLGYNFSEHLNFFFRYSNSLIPVFKSSDGASSPAYDNNNGNSIVLHFIFQYMFSGEKINQPSAGENTNP